MKPANKIWINGKVRKISNQYPLDFHQGLNYGACIYDGIRVYQTQKGPAIFRLDDHIARFLYSASALRMNINMSHDNIAQAIMKTVTANNITSGYIRPIAYYNAPKMGINILNAELMMKILVWPWRETHTAPSMNLYVSSYKRLSPNSIDIKAKIAGYYSGGLLGYIEAQEHGYDEALYLDEKGHISECSISNFFMIKNGTIYTSKKSHILDGITRQTVLRIAGDQRIDVYEKNLTPDFLYDIEDAFISGTSIEMRRVNKIDTYYTDSTPEPSQTLLSLQKYYHDVVHGMLPKYHSWLTWI